MEISKTNRINFGVYWNLVDPEKQFRAFNQLFKIAK